MRLPHVPDPAQEQRGGASLLHQVPSLPTSNVFFSDPDLAKLDVQLQGWSRLESTAEILRYHKEAFGNQDFVHGRLLSLDTILADCHRKHDSQRSRTNSEERVISNELSEGDEGITGASSLESDFDEAGKRRDAATTSYTQDEESLRWWSNAEKLIRDVIAALPEECEDESWSDTEQEKRVVQFRTIETMLLSALWVARRRVCLLSTGVAV